MPRLTNPDYLQIHHRLKDFWVGYQAPFSLLSPAEQLDLHAYFWPSKYLSDEELLAHRKVVTATDPSLPQRAGRALKHFKKAIPLMRQYQASLKAQDKQRSTGNANVWPLILPEPDYHKLARAMLNLARAQKSEASEKEAKS